MNASKSRTVLAFVVLASAYPCLQTTADIITFYPTDDTMIAMKAPDHNYGSSESMTVRNRYGHEGHPDYWERDLLVRFDLSSIPPDTPVSSAVLHLYYHKWWDNDPAGRSLTCYRATSDWDEATVTWNTQPTRASDPSAAALVPHQPGTWMTWDLTDDVQAFIDDPELHSLPDGRTGTGIIRPALMRGHHDEQSQARRARQIDARRMRVWRRRCDQDTGDMVAPLAAWCNGPWTPSPDSIWS
jgi:hypothetical protein